MIRLRTIATSAVAALIGTGLLAAASTPAGAACQLNSADGKIKHVVYIVFDNVHLRRDNPNVPSDIEQMPNLLNFMLQNGVVTANHWTPLISHTATDILTALTGVYGDRMGIPVANSYGFFRPDGSVGFTSSFLYWTALAGDGKPEMLTQDGKTHPAPWVPFTRAGCDVGAFSVANIEFESLPADVRTVFGVGSPEDVAVSAALALPNTPANQAARQAPNTDFLGIAIHCAQGSPLCNNSHGRPDLLPDEPGGYVGFKALFGNVNVQPVISPGSFVKDLDGNVIQDAYGHPGFPNIFNPTATQSLGYAATMLEAGVPVIYAYIADVHERNPLPLDPVTNRPQPNHAFGPGEAEYVAQLKAYDVAFGKFFARLAADGITKDNTLFMVVPDENDHFVGSAPTPANCNGVVIPCTYTFAAEVNAHLNRLLLTQRGNATSFSVHNDDAPTVYITGNPAPTAAVTRTFAHDLDALTAVNPITSNTDKLSFRLADQAEMKLLHMVTSSPARTPTLTMFGNEDYFFFNQTPNTNCSLAPPCVSVPVPPGATFAWNHGDVQTDITRTWLAMAGPGVRRRGRDDGVFSDHTDVRPTLLSLVGLKDSYVHDGRVLVEHLDEKARPHSLRQRQEHFVELAKVYKQLNAPLGSLGRNSLELSNRAVTADDATYAAWLATAAAITAERDALAGEIKAVLDAAAFGDAAVSERQERDLGSRARRLIDQVEDMVGGDRDHGDDRDRDGGD